MGEVYNLDEYRQRKSRGDKESTSNSAAADAIRRSIDNEEVKKRYKLPATPAKAEMNLDQRVARIQNSIKRINKLMGDIRDGEGDR